MTRRSATAWLLAAVCVARWWPPAAAQEVKRKCAHCAKGETFEEFLKPKDADTGGAHSTVHVLWPSHVEVVRVTKDIGGWEPPSLHERLSEEVMRYWRHFVGSLVPSLPEGHALKRLAASGDRDKLIKAFAAWQKTLFEVRGDVAAASLPGLRQTEADDAEGEDQRQAAADLNTTWPELEAMPEYARIRKIVDKFSQRYMERSGMDPSLAKTLNHSIFNWATVQERHDFVTPSSAVGNFNVALFIVKATTGAGKIRLHDPRGHSYPFGREFLHTPRAGDMLIFPSWMHLMFTPTSPSDVPASAEQEDTLVFLNFHVRPLDGPLAPDAWWSDPTADIRFSRAAYIDDQLF